MGNWLNRPLGYARGGRPTWFARPSFLDSGARVVAPYMSNSGAMHNGVVVEVNDRDRTASIAYDDGNFWDAVPFDSMHLREDITMESGSDSDSDSDSDSSSEEAEAEDEKGTCPICLDEKLLSCFYNRQSNEHFQIVPCKERFCRECFSTHVNTVIDSGAWQVRCPGELCYYVLSAKDVRKILSPSKFQKWQAARNKSYYERFMSNDQEMRDALGVDKLVANGVKKRKREEEAKAYWKSKKLKVDDAALGQGVRVLATYGSSSGPMYKGTILEVDVQNVTASITYDDGDFWDSAPLTSIQVLGSDDEVGNLKEEDIVVGKRVLAGWTNGEYYPGTIASVNKEEKTASIEYDDGDAWEKCPFKQIRESQNTERNPQDDENSPEKLETLKEEDVLEGKRVMARWPDSNGSFYPGIITSVNKEEKTASIEYDDGDERNGCPFQQIREARMSLKCCPQCAVIIHKYDGCNSMTCLCGESFDWRNSPTVPSKIIDNLVEKEMKTKS